MDSMGYKIVIGNLGREKNRKNNDGVEQGDYPV
jgi:hypothetical protein